ncbi:GH25 family lysozyme [Streptomyces sp. NBC_01497]|uniref:GH25 family lysozyme n=1 Tax=Streptomyces sp. NBC_01497 TaxID=2903885 RepID=UPI002E3126D3|nr:GH25 family lysozyme [Streptomyces sp. NBC_01497]
MTIKGIDVSSYQAPTWSTSGLSFVFAKATEGHTVVDSSQAAHAARARGAGLVFGQYHFMWPGDIQAQASWFAEKSVTVEGDMMAVDWERTGSGTMASNADKDALIKAIKALRPDHKVGLYTNSSTWLNVDRTSYFGDFLWIAEYGVAAGHPKITAKWTFHQYTDTPLDTNVGHFANRAALAAWAGASTSSITVSKTKVSLKNLVAAAKSDPKAAQGHASHPADVKPVEAALQKLGYLDASYAKDGSFGSLTIAAYSAFQKAYSKAHGLGWTGDDVNGIPGATSLKALATEAGTFTETA